MLTIDKLHSVKKLIGSPKVHRPTRVEDILRGFKRPKGTILFGLENEIGPDSHELRRELREIVGNYAAIHGDSGATEVASPPLTYNDAHKYIDILFAKDLDHASNYQHGFWGMHVHVSRETCRGSHLDRLIRLLTSKDPLTIQILSAIAERSVFRSNESDGYAVIPTYNTFVKSFSNSYKGRGVPRNLREESQFLLKRQSLRYGLFVNTDWDTHEFRFFRSTVDKNKAKANLQAVKSLIDFTRNSSGAIQQYLSFVRKNRDKYGNLCWWLKKKDLI